MRHSEARLVLLTLVLPTMGTLGAAGCGSDMMDMPDPMQQDPPQGKPPDPPPRPPLYECPTDLDCEWVPAAYALSGSGTDYGNQDLADRPNDGLDIRYIVIHDTETPYDGTLRVFQDPAFKASAHYVIRSQDGHVAQMAKNQNVAWHAGNWYVNLHSIGIEHEGVAIDGARWYTDALYQSSAKLVRYLAKRYNVPLDRAHIIGHDNVPGTLATNQNKMHWDPGPFWDWTRYMALLRQGEPAEGPTDERIAEIQPSFATNKPTVSYCYGTGDCRNVTAQPSSFLYVRTAPDANAALVTNPNYIDEPTRASNWANKASSGQRFSVSERREGWTAIYFSGVLGWVADPGWQAARSAPGALITPRGMAAVPVYGRAYPEESAYPMDLTPNPLSPVYDMAPGQRYVAFGPIASDYYSAPTYAPTLDQAHHRLVRGKTQYYQVVFNHRAGFVKADDVMTVP